MGYLTIKHTGFLGLKELFMASFRVNRIQKSTVIGLRLKSKKR